MAGLFKTIGKVCDATVTIAEATTNVAIVMAVKLPALAESTVASLDAVAKGAELKAQQFHHQSVVEYIAAESALTKGMTEAELEVYHKMIG